MLQDKSLNFFVAFFYRMMRRCFFKIITSLRFIISLWLTLLAFSASAQTTDTTMVDSVSMATTDSITQLNSDDYDDTTVKHIYDTSQYFFSTKNNPHTVFTTQKLAQRFLIDSDVQHLKSEDDFWYVHAAEKMEDRLRSDAKFRDSLLAEKNKPLTDEDGNSFLNSGWFSGLIWFLVIGVFLAAIIYFLFQNKINLFSHNATSGKEDEEDQKDENIFSLNYQQLIQKAEKEKSYRIVIRLLFLQTLKLLSDASVIQYQPDYTDLQYLQQLHHTKYYKEFFKLTNSYEYVWYGKFVISGDQYTIMKNNFLKFQSSIT